MCRIYECFQICECLEFTAPHKCCNNFVRIAKFVNVAKFVNIWNLPLLINVAISSRNLGDTIQVHQVRDFVDSNPGNDSNA